MAAHLKALGILLVFILAQTACAHPSENTSNSMDSSEEDFGRHSSPAQKLFVYTFEQFVPLGKMFAKTVFNVSQIILKDEGFTANSKSNVVEFKKNLTEFVHNYETRGSHVEDILNVYSNMTYFYELPQEKITPESTFVLETMNKYNVKAVVENFVKQFDAFKNELVKMFEENKRQLEQSLQSWYANFNTLKVFQDQFNAVANFLKMA